MLRGLAKKFFGSAHERYIRELEHIVKEINQLETSLATLSDEALCAKTTYFKAQLQKGKTLDDILVEALAVAREAAKRTLALRAYDVQLMGAIVLHRGQIAEMKTGEGKTLVAALAVYLNALKGEGVHVVTVNDYLAKRDASWMGQIYHFLGLEVGVIYGGLNDEARRNAYQADITYATNNELGFDYLRDNMKFSLESMVQRPFSFAVVDEVDSILIDEARTPLIISGPAQDSSYLYVALNKIIPHLQPSDYELDEKNRSVFLSEPGVEHVEALLKEHKLLAEGTLYDVVNIPLLHHTQQALKAHKLFQKDVHYVVKSDRVVIIDEFTGRMMEGRRYSEGLHQAIEAKENVPVQIENQTLATITFQNFFRLYPKLAGMTGTAMTEAGEFEDIYRLSVVEIPTNVPCIRQDHDDEIYLTLQEKHTAILSLVKECHARAQPILIGTTSIEKSEELSAMLKKHKIPHNVLNARYHEEEAHIIAEAGKPKAVTIATNMAGRGTDIQLGGHGSPIEEKEIVMKAGGLFVIGTERHESRRIDNQLRGRAGRQGDPGASKFFLSLEDDLMRIFGSERMNGMLQKFGLKENEAITHPWINKALEKAQHKVEGRNYEIRKQLLRFDDVMNDQRKAVYEQRRDIMLMQDVETLVHDMRMDVIAHVVEQCLPPQSYPQEWDTALLEEEIWRIFGERLPIQAWAKEEGIADQEIKERIEEVATTLHEAKKDEFGAEYVAIAQKQILLQVLDHHWKDHLLTLDHLRQGIHLRAHAQKDPLNEYKREAFTLFETLLDQIRETVVTLNAHMKIQTELPKLDKAEPPISSPTTPSGMPDTSQPLHKKTPRNAPCPCGSGKKYKQCHGRLA